MFGLFSLSFFLPLFYSYPFKTILLDIVYPFHLFSIFCLMKFDSLRPSLLRLSVKISSFTEMSWLSVVSHFLLMLMLSQIYFLLSFIIFSRFLIFKLHYVNQFHLINWMTQMFYNFLCCVVCTYVQLVRKLFPVGLIALLCILVVCL